MAESTDLDFMRQMHLGQDERGFTLVELMVAAMVLVVGLLGAVTLLDGANRTTNLTNGRIGASNLARELVEYTRAADYNTLTGAQLPAYLQARPNMPGGTTSPFQVERRGVTYTVTVSTCVYDDPRDGIGAHTADLTWCDSQAVAGAPVETNPDDYRRATFGVAWKRNGTVRTMTQSTLVVNPSGGLGPRITALVTEPTAQITTGASGSTLSFTATTERAAGVRWSVDAAGKSGDAVPLNADKTSWAINWALGTYGTAPFVVDGVYTLAAQALDSRGIPGEKRVMTIPLNRSAPLAVSSLTGGHNAQFGGVVDLTWKASIERDVVGYRVDRMTATGWLAVCPTTAAFTRRLSCSDVPPSSGSQTYRVVALDRNDILAPSSTLRDGAPRTLTVGGIGSKPPTPIALAVTIEGGVPVLRWTQPAGGTVSFYRIYRDGSALSNRYDTLPATGATEYVDGNAGSVPHTYRVSAVDPSFNESNLSNSAP